MTNETNNGKSICGQIELIIDENLEGMISLKDKELMENHISSCADCANYLENTTALIKNLNSLPKETNVGSSRKNELWKKIKAGIDINKYKSDKVEISSAKNPEQPFYKKYKYYISSAAAAILIGLIFYGVKHTTPTSRLTQQNTIGLETYWKVSNLQGAPTIGDVTMNTVDSIKEGQWIQTNGSSRAELIVADIGKIIIEPNSKIIFVKGTDGNNRILVEYGTINADMKSQPKTFFVEMPSAVASDLGGDYTLTIDSTGDGLVYVRSGKVQVESSGRDAIVPAGNLVMTRKDIGVGTPFNENSSPKFKNALFNFDFGKCSGSCVNVLLNSAKLSDAVSLVNLIPKISDEYKHEVYAKVSNFVPPPNVIKQDSIPYIDESQINEWVDKIQKEVNENVQKNLKEVEKNLEHLKNLDHFTMDSLNALEDFAKNWKFKIKTGPNGKYQWQNDTAYFDKEQFKEDMEKMKKDLKEHQYFDKEQFKEDMENLKEDLKDLNENLKENMHYNNEELKKEMEKVKEEIKKSLKEVEKAKDMKEQISDSLKYRYKFNNNNEDEINDEKEVPVEPQPPQKEDN